MAAWLKSRGRPLSLLSVVQIPEYLLDASSQQSVRHLPNTRTLSTKNCCQRLREVAFLRYIEVAFLRYIKDGNCNRLGDSAVSALSCNSFIFMGIMKEITRGQRSNQLNYVPTRQINEMRNRQCLCGFARFAYFAAIVRGYQPAPNLLRKARKTYREPRTKFIVTASQKTRKGRTPQGACLLGRSRMTVMLIESFKLV